MNGQERLVLTPKEAREILRIGKNGIYKLIKSGDLRCVKFGRKILIPFTEIERFLNK